MRTSSKLTVIHLSFTLLIACMLSLKAFCQEGTRTYTTADFNTINRTTPALVDDNIKVKGVRYGISLGYSYTFDNLYEATISPINSTLILEKTPGTSFMLSTSVSVPIFSKNKYVTNKKYLIKTLNGTDVGEPYLVPYGFSIVAAINLATFNSGQEGSGLFNQKIDGGLGLGYTFNEDIQLAVTYEMISIKQPRSFIKELEGQKITIDGEDLKELDISDSKYFTDKYVPSISVKVVYVLNKN